MLLPRPLGAAFGVLELTAASEQRPETEAGYVVIDSTGVLANAHLWHSRTKVFVSSEERFSPILDEAPVINGKKECFYGTCSTMSMCGRFAGASRQWKSIDMCDTILQGVLIRGQVTKASAQWRCTFEWLPNDEGGKEIRKIRLHSWRQR